MSFDVCVAINIYVSGRSEDVTPSVGLGHRFLESCGMHARRIEKSLISVISVIIAFVVSCLALRWQWQKFSLCQSVARIESNRNAETGERSYEIHIIALHRVIVVIIGEIHRAME